MKPVCARGRVRDSLQHRDRSGNPRLARFRIPRHPAQMTKTWAPQAALERFKTCLTIGSRRRIRRGASIMSSIAEATYGSMSHQQGQARQPKPSPARTRAAGAAPMRRAALAAVLLAFLACSGWNGWSTWSRISQAQHVLFSGPSSPEIEKRRNSSLSLVEREEISRAVAAELAILIVAAAGFTLVRLVGRKNVGTA